MPTGWDQPPSSWNSRSVSVVGDPRRRGECQIAHPAPPFSAPSGSSSQVLKCLRPPAALRSSIPLSPAHPQAECSDSSETVPGHLHVGCHPSGTCAAIPGSPTHLFAVSGSDPASQPGLQVALPQSGSPKSRNTVPLPAASPLAVRGKELPQHRVRRSVRPAVNTITAREISETRVKLIQDPRSATGPRTSSQH